MTTRSKHVTCPVCGKVFQAKKTERGNRRDLFAHEEAEHMPRVPLSELRVGDIIITPGNVSERVTEVEALGLFLRVAHTGGRAFVKKATDTIVRPERHS